MTLREFPSDPASGADVLLEPPSGDSPAADIRSLLEGARFELLPLKKIRAAAGEAAAGTVVTITCSPKTGMEGTLRAAETLTAEGHRVVPHIAARMVRDKSHLDEILAAAKGFGLVDAFIPGGDAKEPAGPYTSALDLLRAMDERGHPFEALGVAAYPEGHWLVDDRTIHDELREKQRFATYAVTQMCFSGETIASYVKRLPAEEGIHLPIYAGVSGALDRLKLATIGVKIGIGQSLRFLKHQSGGIGNLFGAGHYEPTELLESLAANLTGPHLLRGLHVYTFNQVAKTETWRQALLGRLSA